MPIENVGRFMLQASAAAAVLRRAVPGWAAAKCNRCVQLLRRRSEGEAQRCWPGVAARGASCAGPQASARPVFMSAGAAAAGHRHRQAGRRRQRQRLHLRGLGRRCAAPPAAAWAAATRTTARLLPLPSLVRSSPQPCRRRVQGGRGECGGHHSPGQLAQVRGAAGGAAGRAAAITMRTRGIAAFYPDLALYQHVIALAPEGGAPAGRETAREQAEAGAHRWSACAATPPQFTLPLCSQSMRVPQFTQPGESEGAVQRQFF